MTGTRVAGILGIVPVVHSVESCHSRWHSIGYNFGDARLLLAVWVDNLFAFGKSIHAAIQILSDIRITMHKNWNLEFKDGSTMCLAPRGNNELPIDSSLWPRCSSMIVLGHTITDDGSIGSDWKQAKKCMWAAFGGNVGTGYGKSSPVKSAVQSCSSAMGMEVQ